ncbi:MAG: sigma-70 family RNA polymerase sigma factor [Steroidobacteraceae bacterium]|jgi:RNA polymerase sigma factor (sigma-70 family)|nr:sigma-70 family RNA polymerase sigma factor [Steroidobacteraceae bacterium]
MSPGSRPDASWADERLVQGCLQGDERAWAALIGKYKRLIYSIPFRYGATPADAADIFQSVCSELLAELPRIRDARSLRSWLTTVTARRALRWKQSRLRRREDTLDTTDAGEDAGFLAAPDEFAELERSQAVTEAVARLGDRCRLLVQRLFFDDPPLPYEELARELGLATGSIGFTRARCLEKLRALLEEEGGP